MPVYFSKCPWRQKRCGGLIFEGNKRLCQEVETELGKPLPPPLTDAIESEAWWMDRASESSDRERFYETAILGIMKLWREGTGNGKRTASYKRIAEKMARLAYTYYTTAWDDRDIDKEVADRLGIEVEWRDEGEYTSSDGHTRVRGGGWRIVDTGVSAYDEVIDPHWAEYQKKKMMANITGS